MADFTKDAPFKFEGVSIWRTRGGLVRYNHPCLDATVIAHAMHAFIEAERGRKSTSTVYIDIDASQLVNAVRSFKAAMRDANPRLAQPAPQPPEPTEFGAMVRLGVKTYVRAELYSCLDGGPWVLGGTGTRHTWDELTDLGPVEVLR